MFHSISIMASDSSKTQTKPKPKTLSQEQIVAGFNQLRQEQRQLANKIVELEGDVTEHKLVIETLNEVDGNRKCFRMIGGVLVERTVKEVLPSLENNKEKILQLIETLKAQIVNKGKEISEYMDKHNIQIRQEQVMQQGGGDVQDANSKGQSNDTTQSTSGVLVDSSSQKS